MCLVESDDEARADADRSHAERCRDSSPRSCGRSDLAEPCGRVDASPFSRDMTRLRLEGRRARRHVARHPMHHLGGFFAEPRPFLPADHVTTDAGTGLVHMAPDHGEEDFLVCKAAGIDPVFAVDRRRQISRGLGWLGGQGCVINNKFNAPDGPICSDLREAGGLARRPAPISSTATRTAGAPRPRSSTAARRNGSSRWTARAEPETCARPRSKAIDDTRWVPEKVEEPDARDGRGAARLGDQPPARLGRADRALRQPQDRRLSEGPGGQQPHPPRLPRGRRRRLVRRRSPGPARQRLQPRRLRAGHRHSRRLVRFGLDPRLRDRGALRRRTSAPTSIARARTSIAAGSSPRLLESCGTRGRAPFDAVLTHGFALDQNGRKMSKSIGNVVDPLAIIRDSGADILRLWVASTDYFEDVRIGKEMLAATTDAYRKLRNSFRYLLGALDGFSADEAVPAGRHARARALGAAPARHARRGAARGGRGLRVQPLRAADHHLRQ